MSSRVIVLAALLTADRNISAPAGVSGFFPTCDIAAAANTTTLSRVLALFSDLQINQVKATRYDT